MRAGGVSLRCPPAGGLCPVDPAPRTAQGPRCPPSPLRTWPGPPAAPPPCGPAGRATPPRAAAARPSAPAAPSSPRPAAASASPAPGGPSPPSVGGLGEGVGAMQKSSGPHTQLLPHTRGPAPGTGWGGGGVKLWLSISLCPFFPLLRPWAPPPGAVLSSSPPSDTLLLLSDCHCPVLSSVSTAFSRRSLLSASASESIARDPGNNVPERVSGTVRDRESDPKTQRREQENWI